MELSTDVKDDASYWKNLAQKHLEEKQEIQRELEEHVEFSRQMEKELEIQLAQEETKSKELKSFNSKVSSELESIRTKLDQNNREVAKLQSEVLELNEQKNHLMRYIRELEQKNDDLERSERVITESVAVVQSSLNLAIERNAILESEVDEKESLKEKLQRLIDEMRDLKQESMAKERAPDNDRSFNGHLANLSTMDSNRLRVEIETQTSPIKGSEATAECEDNGRPARLMALNLVNEILKKIGKLESKIAAHRANERNMSDPSKRNIRRTGRSVPSSTAKLSPLTN